MAFDLRRSLGAVVGCGPLHKDVQMVRNIKEMMRRSDRLCNAEQRPIDRRSDSARALMSSPCSERRKGVYLGRPPVSSRESAVLA